MTPRRLIPSAAYALARSQCNDEIHHKLIKPAESLIAFYPTRGTQVSGTETWFVRMRAPSLPPLRVLYRIEERVGCHLLAMEIYDYPAPGPMSDYQTLNDPE